MANIAQVDVSLTEGHESRPLEAALDRISELEAEVCRLTARLEKVTSSS